MWRLPKIGGTILGFPNKDCSILGSIFRILWLRVRT